MNDKVCDGRDRMENDGQMSFERQLDYQIKYGGRPFTPQGIADNIDAAALVSVYAMFRTPQATGDETV